MPKQYEIELQKKTKNIQYLQEIIQTLDKNKQIELNQWIQSLFKVIF